MDARGFVISGGVMAGAAALTTTERGLGWEHQKQRRRLLRLHVDGTLCDWCGEPMYKWQDLNADHTIERVRGGRVADRLLHASCDAARGNQTMRDLKADAAGSAPASVSCKFHDSCGSRHSRDW